MILLSSMKNDDAFHVQCCIHSTDASGELTAILKAVENEHPEVLAHALDYLMDGTFEVDG